MLTLTLRHRAGPLHLQMDRLYTCFRNLRAREAWRENVAAGAAAVEITTGRLGSWHVHMHVLIVGRYWSQRDISAEWLAVTGDSDIVDIRAMPTERAVGYAAKYLGKGASSDVEQNEPMLIEAIKALKGRRMLIVFGDWFGKLCEEDQEIPEKGEWIAVASLEKLVEWAGRGDEAAIGILEQLSLTPEGFHRATDPPRRSRHRA